MPFHLFVNIRYKLCHFGIQLETCLRKLRAIGQADGFVIGKTNAFNGQTNLLVYFAIFIFVV